MNVIKRNGVEVKFDINKIITAIDKANADVPDSDKIPMDKIKTLAIKIETYMNKLNRTLSVEEIQDLVEDNLLDLGYINLGKEYIKYRYKRALVRKSNSTDEQILSIIDCKNQDIKEENSNKNPTIVSVQRDYMAGEVSKDLTKRFLVPPDIIKAHEEGLIHFHKLIVA